MFLKNNRQNIHTWNLFRPGCTVLRRDHGRRLPPRPAFPFHKPDYTARPELAIVIRMATNRIFRINFLFILLTFKFHDVLLNMAVHI